MSNPGDRTASAGRFRNGAYHGRCMSPQATPDPPTASSARPVASATGDELVVLFTDIEGSTRLWEQHPDRMAAALACHDALVRTLVEAHHGTLVKMIGDGAHAVFDDAHDALLAALQLQQSVVDPAATAGVTLKVRCGLHAGVVEQRDNDYFGTAVNRASRITSVAHGGQLLLSSAVADRVGERLPAQTSLRDLGSVRLRDLARPEHVYQLLHPDLRQDFPALRSLEATPNNLPQQVTSFVGHERELADVRELLGETRLLTLVGMGGIGKTRLSLQVAADVLDDYPDGVWFVELAAVADPRRVPEAVATVVGVMEDAGRPVVEALVRYVTDRQLLLILDNCEHVIGACAALAKALLQAGSRLKILTSSREQLRVAGETTYAVPALALPDLRDGIASDAVQRNDAVRLFAERAAAVRPAFRIAADNETVVAQICRRLDGIPLAIELAAARINALTVEAIAERLGDRFSLLTRGSRTALPRQRTLRALIDWSHDLLDDAEQALFARLSVFAGGMTLDAVEAVGAGEGSDATQVLDLLVALVEKSLVELDAGGARYRMLEIVREYAQQKLGASADGDATRTRHLAFFLRLAERAQPELWGPAQGEWLRRLDPDRDNFLAALAWCDRADDGAVHGLRMVNALQLYWLPRGLIELGYRLTAEALDREGARQRDLHRSSAQYAASQLAYFMGSYEAARRHGEECLSIAREFGVKVRAAAALLLLGYASDALGEPATAQRQFEESAALAREVGDRSRLSFALNALAGHHQERRDLNTAETLFEEALALARELNDQESVAIGLPNLARLLVERGAADRARVLLREGVSIACAIGSARAVQNVLEVAAGLAVLHGDWVRAVRYFGAGEAQLAQMAIKRTPEDNAVLMRSIVKARDALGDSAFLAAESAGRALTYDDAIEDARAWLARTA